MTNFTLGFDVFFKNVKSHDQILIQFGSDGFKNLIVSITSNGEIKITYRYGPDRLKKNLYS